MPTYEYKCDSCEHELEEFQSIMDKPLKKCPQCGKNQLRRLISGGGGIVFKGSGFYQTDYRSEAYKSAVKSEKPAETAASAPVSKKDSAAHPNSCGCCRAAKHCKSGQS